MARPLWASKTSIYSNLNSADLVARTACAVGPLFCPGLPHNPFGMPITKGFLMWLTCRSTYPPSLFFLYLPIVASVLIVATFLLFGGVLVLFDCGVCGKTWFIEIRAWWKRNTLLIVHICALLEISFMEEPGSLEAN